MKLIARRQLSTQWRHRRNSHALKQTGGPSLTGSLEQIGQIHAPDLIRRERRDQQKSKNKQQKQAQLHDTWKARHARDTRSTYNASELTGSVRDTIPRQQDQRERQQQQQHHIMLVGFLK